MKYGIFCTKSKKIILDAGETIDEAKELMSRLNAEEGKKFFGTSAEGKEIWTISPYFEPLEKI